MRPDRQPPHAPEAELCVLGGMLIDADAIATALEVVDAPMFYHEANRTLFKAMSSLYQAGGVVDPATLGEWLSARNLLASVGGYDRIAEVLDAVPTAANIEYHARIIRERYQRRQVIKACEHGIQLAHDADTENVADAVGSLLSAASSDGGRMEAVRLILDPTFRAIEDRQNGEGGITGIATGLGDLDEMTGGLQRGDLVIVAARPSMGKTALVTGIGLHAAIQEQVPVAIFSFEMSKKQVVERMLCSEGLVSLHRLLKGRLWDDDYGRLAQAAGHLNTAPIFIEDGGAQNVLAVKAGARRLKRENPELGLVIVDYIQLMEGEGENRNQEVSAISRGLKGLARELNVVVIALSQLSRNPEQRSNHRPMLSDLRESGSIEQDADLVAFLYRPEYYDASNPELQGKAELIIGKHRNGPTGDIDLYFRKECARFESSPKWGVAA